MSAFRALVVITATITLTACATTDDRGTVIDADSEYVAHVESIALRRGVDVQWINVPTKRTTREE